MLLQPQILVMTTTAACQPHQDLCNLLAGRLTDATTTHPSLWVLPICIENLSDRYDAWLMLITRSQIVCVGVCECVDRLMPTHSHMWWYTLTVSKWTTWQTDGWYLCWLCLSMWFGPCERFKYVVLTWLKRGIIVLCCARTPPWAHILNCLTRYSKTTKEISAWALNWINFDPRWTFKILC